jgi:hypothetical protein
MFDNDDDDDADADESSIGKFKLDDSEDES